MTEFPDEIDDPRISERLHDVLTMIMCPIAGCWSLHGAESVIYYDGNIEAFILESWPVRVKAPEDHEGNGHADVLTTPRPLPSVAPSSVHRAPFSSELLKGVECLANLTQATQ